MSEVTVSISQTPEASVSVTLIEDDFAIQVGYDANDNIPGPPGNEGEQGPPGPPGEGSEATLEEVLQNGNDAGGNEILNISSPNTNGSATNKLYVDTQISQAVVAEAQARNAAVLAEATARTNADNALQSSVNALTGQNNSQQTQINNLITGLSNETANRESADSSFAQQLSDLNLLFDNNLGNIHRHFRAGENLDEGDLCYVDTDGFIYKVTTNDPITNYRPLGIVAQSVASGSESELFLAGVVVFQNNLFQPGELYYASETGVIDSAPSRWIVGMAILENVLVVRIQDLSFDSLQNVPASFPPDLHSHDASDITSGVIDPARIPVVVTQDPPVIPAGGSVASLTPTEQTRIDAGTIVVSFDGKRFLYTGVGDKTDELSYILLADVTPDWSVIAEKPTAFNPTAHQHDASEITSGTIDPARIPILVSQQAPVVPAGGTIASLTVGEQAQVLSGTVVTLLDGRRMVYIGSGSKTSEANYIQLADITPDWSVIANKPIEFPPSDHNHDASEITSGIFARERLGSGIADSSVFLRGDGVWDSPNNQLTLWEHFNHFLSSTARPDVETIGNTGTGAGLSLVQTPSPLGVIVSSTGTTATGSQIIRHTNNNAFQNNSLKKHFKSRINIPILSDGTNTFSFFAGFSNGITAALAAQQVGFRYTHSENGGAWTCFSRQSNTESNVSSGVTVIAATWYTLEVVLTSTLAEFYINNVLVASITTNLPTSGGSQYFGYMMSLAKSVGTTARTVQYDYYHVKIFSY